MTVKIVLLALTFVAAAVSAHAQAGYPGDRAITAAQAEAKSASFICEKALKAGGKSPATCGRYHSAVLRAMTLDRKRQAWCGAQFATEASNIRVPDSCLGQKSPDLRLEAVEGLERKVSPAAWKAFDKQMEDLP